MKHLCLQKKYTKTSAAADKRSKKREKSSSKKTNDIKCIKVVGFLARDKRVHIRCVQVRWSEKGHKRSESNPMRPRTSKSKTLALPS